jgi:hypothetical protein
VHFDYADWLSFLLYYPKEDYDKISTMEDIKIIYGSGKEFVVETNDTTYAKLTGDSLVVNQGTEEKFIQMSEVEKIKENRFDVGGTITLTVIGLMILVILFAISYDTGG